jgi:hypothetical protein
MDRFNPSYRDYDRYESYNSEVSRLKEYIQHLQKDLMDWKNMAMQSRSAMQFDPVISDEQMEKYFFKKLRQYNGSTTIDQILCLRKLEE